MTTATIPQDHRSTLPLMVRNMMTGPTVFSDPATKSYIEWKGSGDEEGGDIQPVPPEYAYNIKFQQALTKGILAVVEEEGAAEEAAAAHKAEWDARQERRLSAGKEVLEREQDNDVLMLECLGPAGHSGELCKEPVAVKSASRFDAPPLCSKHAYLKGQFAPEETDRMVGNRHEIVWRRAAMGPRESAK